MILEVILAVIFLTLAMDLLATLGALCGLCW